MTDPTKDAALPPELEDLAQREGHAPEAQTQEQRRYTQAFETMLAEYDEKIQAVGTIASIRPASRAVQRLAATLVLTQVQHVRIDLNDLVELLKTETDEDLFAAFAARREVAEQLHAMADRLATFTVIGADIAKTINALAVAEKSAGGS